MSHRGCRRLFRCCCYVVCLLPCSVIRECFCQTVQGQNTKIDFRETNLSKSARGIAWMLPAQETFVKSGVFVVVLIILCSPLRKWIWRWLSSKGFCVLTRIKQTGLFRRWCHRKKFQNGNGDPEMGTMTTPKAQHQIPFWRLLQWRDGTQKLKLEITDLRNELESVKSDRNKLEYELQASKHECFSLRNDNTRLQEEISAYKLRLSKMASERMRDDNPTVEDLNDPRRPTALVSRWTGLFRCGEYWTAYETVKKEKGEDNAASILHKICQATYETTKRFVEDLTQVLIVEVSHRRSSEPDTADRSRRQTLEEFIFDKDERESILGRLEDILSQMVKDGNSEGKSQGGRSQEGKAQDRKAILRLLRSRNPLTSLSQAVTRAVGELKVSPELIRSFVNQLTELIYYMRVQDIKVVVDFDCKAGRRLNPALYEVESGKAVDNPGSAVVKAVMRPALLRHEQGPVLCKGEVELETPPKPTAAAMAELRPQPGNNSNMLTQEVGPQPAADLAASDEKNARPSTEEDTVSTDEESKVASPSTDAAVLTAEQLQQSSLAVTGKAPPQKGDSDPSAANPHGGVHEDPTEVEPVAPAGTDPATVLAQENAVTDTSLQPPQNDRNQQEANISEAATTNIATSPAPLADQSADTVINME